MPAVVRSDSDAVKSTCWRAYSVVSGEHVPSKRKVWDSVDEAIADVKSGDVLLSGGMYSSIVAHAEIVTERRNL